MAENETGWRIEWKDGEPAHVSAPGWPKWTLLPTNTCAYPNKDVIELLKVARADGAREQSVAAEARDNALWQVLEWIDETLAVDNNGAPIDWHALMRHLRAHVVAQMSATPAPPPADGEREREARSTEDQVRAAIETVANYAMSVGAPDAVIQATNVLRWLALSLAAPLSSPVAEPSASVGGGEREGALRDEVKAVLDWIESRSNVDGGMTKNELANTVRGVTKRLRAALACGVAAPAPTDRGAIEREARQAFAREIAKKLQADAAHIRSDLARLLLTLPLDAAITKRDSAELVNDGIAGALEDWAAESLRLAALPDPITADSGEGGE